MLKLGTKFPIVVFLFSVEFNRSKDEFLIEIFFSIALSIQSFRDNFSCANDENEKNNKKIKIDLLFFISPILLFYLVLLNPIL